MNTLATITDRKAGFRSLGDAWADTTTAHGRLMLTVLGGLAEFERELIRARTGEGRSRAKANGEKHGPPAEADPAPEEGGAYAARERGAMREIARSYNVSDGDDFEVGSMSNVIEVATWDECYASIQSIRREHPRQAQNLWFRGQSNSEWRLTTTLERRTSQAFSFIDSIGWP